MRTIELFPDLSHCIETVARQEHEEAARKLLAADRPDEELAWKAETLRLFLETADLRKLRAESEKQLLEGRRVRFRISAKDGAAKYEMDIL